MALQSSILHLAHKNLLQESCKQFLRQARGLHKSTASGSLEIAAHSQAELKEENEVSPAAEALKETTVKTLQEMPGPSTFSNLVEFFYRDGFSRIHEIQVSGDDGRCQMGRVLVEKSPLCVCICIYIYIFNTRSVEHTQTQA